MKKIIALIVCLLACSFGISAENKKTVECVLQGGSLEPSEGILIEITRAGEFQLDSGTILKDANALEAWLTTTGKVFSPLLKIDREMESLDHYRKFQQAVFLFQKHCKTYLVVFSKETKSK